MRAWVLALLAALTVHALILLFGGVFFLEPEETDVVQVEEVDLLTAEAEEEEPEEVEEAPREDLRVDAPAPPEMPAETETAPPPEPTDLVARLDALSLGALESTLDGASAADGGFALGGGLASGGRIGGTGMPGTAGGLGESSQDLVFDIGALDQQPRLVHQVPPTYPRELRQRKVEGTVFVVFIVDTDGRVVKPSVEGSPNAAFDLPALEAVRRWRFEPAVARGEKVRTRMRVPIRFSLSG